MICVVGVPLRRPLVARAVPTMCARLLALPTDGAAVGLSTIVGAADVEHRRAPATAQLKEKVTLVHPSRRDKNWTGALASARVLGRLAIHPSPVHEGPGGNLGPHFFHPPLVPT
jgi:hypothetical protein